MLKGCSGEIWLYEAKVWKVCGIDPIEYIVIVISLWMAFESIDLEKK